MKKLSWTPKRDGEVYCSPACGYKCKYLDYLDAVEKAKTLCAALGPPSKWKPYVWENIGWHYRAVSYDDRWFVYGKSPSRPMAEDKYSAGFNQNGGIGSHFWCSNKNAKKALQATQRAVREHVASFGSLTAPVWPK